MLEKGKGQKDMMLVADNIQITRAVIENAVRETAPEPIQAMVRECEAAGAQAIDINSGPLSRDPEKKMSFLVRAVQDVSDLPVFIDTANPVALEAGLRANRKTAVINGFSLEPAKVEAILPLAKTYDTDIVGYLLYPDSHVPKDASERLAVAVQLFEASEKAGVDRDRLIIDPIVAPILWPDGNFQNMEILTVIRTLPDLLGFPPPEPSRDFPTSRPVRAPGRKSSFWKTHISPCSRTARCGISRPALRRF
jgi:5-methyltetrahydrofolate corrinoid/iron sulfur protein methyltransferase